AEQPEGCGAPYDTSTGDDLKWVTIGLLTGAALASVRDWLAARRDRAATRPTHETRHSPG
ncbi:MAG TPA: hypothetical protein VGW10_03425, partial [Solirubrobacteraceae bacterium]|nr:hypothetical protein [Solirubrobacteraceae bacterium]